MEPLSSYYYIKNGETLYGSFEDGCCYRNTQSSEKRSGDRKDDKERPQAQKKTKTIFTGRQ
jgi:hypothetical protein